MTRIKKSRKPGVIGSAKSDKGAPEKNLSNRKSQTRKGKKSGSRHSDSQNVSQPSNNSTQKDPRIGSKKPVPLTAPEAIVEKKIKKQPPVEPKVSIKKSTPEPENLDVYWQELDQIENDERLQTILDQLDADEAVDANELAYFNKLQSRHAWLTDKLGIVDEDILDDEDKIIDADEALLDAFEKGFPKE